MTRYTVVLSVALLGALAPLSSQAAPRSAVSALTLVVPDIRFDGTKLSDAVDHLRDISSANFHVNWKALEAQGIVRDTPVTLRARNVTIRKVLDMMLAGLTGGEGLASFNEEGVIEITTKDLADRAVVTRVYDITDLLVILPTIDQNNTSLGTGQNSSSSSSSSNTGSRNGEVSASSGSSRGGGRSGSSYSSGGGGSSGTSGRSSSRGGTASTGTGTGDSRQQMADDVVSLIMDTIEPSIWQENGGTSSVRYFPNGKLIITAPRRIHERIGGPIE